MSFRISLKERVSAIMTFGSLRIEFNSDVEINMNLIKSSNVNSFGFDIRN